MIEPRLFLETSLYFLALINPASKFFILTSIRKENPPQKILWISLRASLTAMTILSFFALAGNFLLRTVFHVEIYSLEIAGGIVLFLVGLTAVQNGKFYEKLICHDSEDISIVPMGAPLIAGPGTITAVVSFSLAHGVKVTLLSLLAAVIINLAVMLSSLAFGKVFEKLRIIGPLVRITGLVVTAVAVQMALTGISKWLDSMSL